jgi:hypothetical protein
MIRWNDFILDDGLGPLLDLGGQDITYPVCRGKRLERPSIKDDAEGTHVGTIQETRRTQRPARMASQADLISLDVNAPGTEVGSGDRAQAKPWHRRGEG